MMEMNVQTETRSLLRVAAPHWFLLVGLVLVAPLSLYCSSVRPLWTDEALSLKPAHAEGLSGLWQTLAIGTQSDPPLFYLAARASMFLFGDNPVAFRLPSLFGALLLSLSLYAFTARRCSLACARLAFLFPLLPPVLRYTYEARPYALWLGWSGLALLCWQVAGDSEGRKRRAALLGLAWCSAASVSTHYYSVLFLAALGLAELVRSGLRRRIDVLVWLGLAAAVVPLLAYRPLIANAKTFIADSWCAARWSNIVYTYQLLAESWACLLFVLLGLVALSATLRHSPAPQPQEEDGFRLDEVLAGLVVAALPFLGMVLAKAYTNNYVPRYVLPMVCGFTILVVATVHNMSRPRRWIAHLVTALTLLLVLYGYRHYLRPAASQEVDPSTFTPAAAEAVARAHESGLPLITDNFDIFVCGQIPGPEKPLTYVCAGGPHNGDPVARKLRPWYSHLIIEPSELPRLKQFLLVPSINYSSTLESLLWKKGAQLHLQRPLSGGGFVYLVQLPSAGEDLTEAAEPENSQ